MQATVTLTSGWLRALVRFPLIVLLLLAGLFIAKTVIPWSGFATPAGGREVRNRCVRTWCRLTSRILNLQIHRVGKPDAQSQLWVANHISWIDILALATEHDLVFIAKHEISTWPLLGSIFKGIGTLFIRRGDREATLRMSQCMKASLEEGISLMLFPEATTTDGKEVRRFASKLFEPAVEVQSQIQPIALRYLGQSEDIAPFIGEDTFLAHLTRVLTLKEIQLMISYGDPLHPQSRSKEQLARSLRHSVIDLLNQERPLHPSGLLQNRHNPFIPLSH